MSRTVGDLRITDIDGFRMGVDGKVVTITADNVNADREITLPPHEGTLATVAGEETLSDKTLLDPEIYRTAGSGNVYAMHFDLPTGEIKDSAGTLLAPNSVDELVTSFAEQTLYHKSLTGTTNTIEASHVGQGTDAMEITGSKPSVAGYALVSSSSSQLTWQSINTSQVNNTSVTGPNLLEALSVPLTSGSINYVTVKVAGISDTGIAVAAKLELTYSCPGGLAKRLGADDVLINYDTDTNDGSTWTIESAPSNGNLVINVTPVAVGPAVVTYWRAEATVQSRLPV